MKRRAYSAVIGAIVLTATVLSVGGAVWLYTYGSGTITAEDYVEEINELINEISERFIVEHVGHTATHLRVWIYNYGDVSIVVDVYVTVEDGASDSSMGHEVNVQELIEVDFELVLSPGDDVSIKAVSRRGNSAIYRYLLPVA